MDRRCRRPGVRPGNDEGLRRADRRQLKLADAIPHATVVTVEGDHGVFVESPKLFAQKLLEACQTAKQPRRKVAVRFLGAVHNSRAGCGAARCRRPLESITPSATLMVVVIRGSFSKHRVMVRLLRGAR